ncbi:hypothetical protein GCM10010185_29360 [Saccharothrix coeruleofusca]|uniref:DUF1360 domain-containing protein n=2 Tax=Saccharothrix coeruleofusca TaxID=33919 RepID=A0A918ALX9_9PSEU|nr:hypothetical protein GCM10010185_29360 [Saccharothrix coeruleofusca]
MSLVSSFYRVRAAYSGEDDRPLAGYLASMGTYAGLVGLAAAVGRRRGARLPERFSLADTALLAVATHKASRLLTKSSIASALRAPFTRYEEPAGEAELNESVRADNGVQHAVGELVTCPFCTGVWMAGGLTAGLVLAPRATRLVITALTAVAGSDYLHLAYAAAKKHVAE